MNIFTGNLNSNSNFQGNLFYFHQFLLGTFFLATNPQKCDSPEFPLKLLFEIRFPHVILLAALLSST
jgi:hypothetical protein